MINHLFTTGYEGINSRQLLEKLKKHNINCVIDVRELPLSRKQGFSKSSLRANLNRENIQYVHLKKLGSPKPIRYKLKADKDYGTFFKSMSDYLDNQQESIETAYRYVKNNNCCLICFEKLAAMCHRKVVARKIKEFDGNGLEIENI